MRKLKKVAAMILAGAMTFAMSTTAFAATGITASEQKILAEAESKAAELGVPTTNATYQKYYAQATAYLAANELNEEQVSAAINSVDTAAATAKTEMEKQGVSSVLELTNLKSVKSAAVSETAAILEKAGFKVSVDADNVEVQALTTDSTGDTSSSTVASTSDVIKQTGSDMTATAGVAVAVVGAIAACGIVAKKKDLFAGMEA